MSRMSSKVSSGGGGTKLEPQQQGSVGGTGNTNSNNNATSTASTGASVTIATSNPAALAPPSSTSSSSVQTGRVRTKGSSTNQIQNLSSQKESNNNNANSTNNNSKSVSSSKSVPQNNQSKPSSSNKSHSSSSKNKSSLSNKTDSASTGLPPPAPSSSPVPPPSQVRGSGGDESDDVDDLEVDVEDCDDVDDLEGEDGDLDDEDEYDQDDGDPDDEDGDEDDENPLELELDGHDDLTEPCERSLPGGGGHANNNSASSYNSPIFLGSSSEEEEDDEGEVDESLERDESDEEEDDDEDGLEPSGFLLPPDGDSASIQGIPPDAQARLEAFFEAAGFTDGKLMSDPENLRKLTMTVSSALGEASAAINRMRDSQRKSMEEGRNDSMEEGDSLLALACSSGYFELARVLLAMGANVDDRGSKGDLTPLMDAASQGHLEIVRLLLSHGADVNAQSACGNSPLMYACAAGHEDIVRELLKSGARVEDNNENGHTPLMEAASAGHVGVAKILLEHGAGINTHSNEFKESALTVACYKGHLEMVRFLLEAGADQQHKTDEMHTALMEASMDGHVEVARLLLDSGAQVNMPADSFESPLTLAACGGHVELAELLIERGANIEEVNDEGYTPLMEAAREGHLAVVKCLLKHGAKINAQTEETHETALTLAACGGFLDVVDTLCNAGADIELGASTPLMEASQEGHYQVVKYLLDRGADITRQTQTGDTALSYACENGHVDVVELLIQKGADPEHLSEGGRTPLMKACRGGHLDVIKFLLGKGADVNRQTASNDHTPLSLACAGGHIAAVEVLLAAGANPFHKLKDGSTMIIEAARGGHTNVIRALLDYPPREKQQQGQAVPTGTSKQPQLKAAPIPAKSQQQSQYSGGDSKGSGQSSSQSQQNKSVLRKSRSTSTLESSAATQQQHQQQKQSSNGSNDQSSENAQSVIKAKQHQQPQSGSSPSNNQSNQQQGEAQLKNFNLPLGDGKVSVSAILPNKNEPGTVPQRKAASGNEVCNACSGNGASKIAESHLGHHHPQAPQAPQHQQHANAKRPALSGPEGIIAPTSVSSSTSIGSGVLVSPVNPSTGGCAPQTSGPPLVPSQVTAATAISERPKAKANKPSARKQVQLQQQLQQQLLQQQQQQHQQQQQGNTNQQSPQSPGGQQQTPGSPTCTPVVASTGSGGIAVPTPASCSGMLLSSTQTASAESLRSQAAAANAAVLSQATGLKIGAVSTDAAQQLVSSPAFLSMQVQQILTHQSQFQIYNKDKKGYLEATGPYEHLNLIEGTPTEMLDFTQVLAGAYSAGSGSAGQIPALAATGGLMTGNMTSGQPGTATTTTTTTVVVTHGNGETETIIEGDNLPPGANEMIMSAAAAAFPIDCFPGTLTATGTTDGVPGSPGQVQVQSYQLTTPSAAALTLAPDLAPLTTTTMHTTTIINSSGSASASFQPQILLPHPPPLPQAIAAAAAAAGLIPPSGAPPDGALRQLQQQQQHHHHQQQQTSAQNQTKQVSGTASTQTKTQMVKDKCIQGVTQVKPSSQVSSTSSVQAQHGSGTQTLQKKQVAKRTRPFCQQQLQQQHHQVASKGQSHSVASTQTTPTASEKSSNARALDVDSATESNGETSLSIAAASGHYEVVEFLIGRKAHIEHRDKKGYTPLILAADGGHEKVVELLLNNGADIEAQSERTKDTALSLACTKGRYEVVELLLKRGANKEHRNVSDYTPLSLAASGGYVNIIKLLLTHGAEINSRTGSKLGISPLMLAAMNGNTAAVKLLLDMGSDINAQIETNKNTALTLACFQGRHEVVQLLLERKANLEHRAKTGLTPLMEAANGGYVEVGKILIEKGAEVNAAPVPATRDTALTIAADKGHYRFVELLLNKGAIVDARNKKGCTPLWLACHGGHLDVAQILFRHRADLDSQDNRKISCLMAAFRKGHVKVIRWIVKNVQQFPSDQEMSRYILGLQNEPDLLKRCQQCSEYIKQAKDKQALEANKNATILLEELDMEKSREESKRLAAQRRREKKKKKKMEKKKQLFGNQDDDDDDDDDLLRNRRSRAQDDDDDDDDDDEEIVVDVIDSGIDANSQGSSSSQTQGDSNRRRNQNQQLSSIINSKSKGKENLTKVPQPVPPQRSASSKSVSSNNSSGTPPIPDAIVEESVAQPNPPSKSSRKKKNKSSKSQNSNAENKFDSENNNNSSEVMKNINNNNITKSNSTSNTTKENVQYAIKSQSAGSVQQMKSHSKGSSSGQDHVLKEKVEVDTVASGNKTGTKKDKKGRGEPDGCDGRKSGEQTPNVGTLYQQQNVKGLCNQASATSHGVSSASVNKKVKGGLETNPVPEPLMGISLSPSQLKKASGGGLGVGGGAVVYSAAITEKDHDLGHVSVFTSPGPVSSSTSSTKGGSNLMGSSVVGPIMGKSGGGIGIQRKGDDGWKEVTRNCPSSRSKRVIVPSSVISRVIGRGGCNINAIREATGAHIEVEKQQKGQVQPERTIQIKGSAEATKQAHNLITALMNEPDLDVKKLLPGTSSTGGRNSNSTSSTGATSVTPTPSSIQQFPVIGSVTTLLQQQEQLQRNNSSGVSQNISNVTPTLPSSSGSGSGGSISNMSTPVDIALPSQGLGGGISSSTSGNKSVPFGSSGKGMKGSPTSQQRSAIIGSGSPPLPGMKTGSPPIKKPVVVGQSQQNSRNNMGNKRSGCANSGIGTFAAKLVQPTGSQQLRGSQQDSQTWDNRQTTQSNSNATPTPIGTQSHKRMTPTAGVIGQATTPVTPASTPPPPSQVSTSPSSHVQSSTTTRGGSSYGIALQQQPQPIGVGGAQQLLQGMANGPLTMGGIPANGIIDGGNKVEVDNTITNPRHLDHSNSSVDSKEYHNPPRNLAPGSNPNSVNVAPSSSSVSTSQASGGQRSSLDMDHQNQQRTPLEYSPFNYTFSKTAGWFPGDLAVNSSGINVSGSGMHGGLSGSTTSLNSSVARAMNFASVAASGISTSTLSTSQAQMSQAGMQQNGNSLSQAAANALGLTQSSVIGGKMSQDGIDSIVGEASKVTADVSKAPGYRGSPVLRQMQQPPPSSSSSNSGAIQTPNNPGGYGIAVEGPLSSHFAAAAGITTGPGGLINFGGSGSTQAPGAPVVSAPGQQQRQQGPAQQFNQQFGQDVMNQQMLYSNNRLNPRAPSFNLPMGKTQSSATAGGSQSQGNQSSIQGPGPNNTPNSMTFHQSPSQNHQFGGSSMHHQQQQQQAYKSMGSCGPYQSGNRGGQTRAVGSSSTPNHNWNAYNSSAADDALLNFPGFAALAASAGIVDAIGGMIPGMDPMLSDSPLVPPPPGPKTDDRRQLPRPIGGERAWKQNSQQSGQGHGGNVGGNGGLSGGMGAGLQGFAVSPLDCIDAGPLPQPIQIPPSSGVGGGNLQQNQSQPHWFGGLYPQSTSSSGGNGGYQQGQQPPPQLNLGAHGPPKGSGSGDARNILGRRFMDEMDGRGIMELQQQIFEGQRLMNGAGAGVHPLMHLQNPPMGQQAMFYGAGGTMEHGLETQHNLPKIDPHSTWDAQLMMEEKLMGGWGATKWNN